MVTIAKKICGPTTTDPRKNETGKFDANRNLLIAGIIPGLSEHKKIAKNLNYLEPLERKDFLSKKFILGNVVIY